MKILCWAIAIVALTINISSCTQSAPKAQNPAISTHNKVEEDYFARISHTLYSQPITAEHLCMNLTSQEITDLQLGYLSTEAALPNTCNEQYIVMESKTPRILAINFFESLSSFPKNLIQPFTHSSEGTTINDAVKFHDLDVLRSRVTKTSATKTITQSTTMMTANECSLATRIPAGLIVVSYREKATRSSTNPDLCITPSYVLGVLLDHHTHRDASSPTFCLDVDSRWLSRHNLVSSSHSKGCQDVTLAWNNENYHHSSPNRSLPDEITIRIARSYMQFEPTTIISTDNHYGYLSLLNLSPFLPHHEAYTLCTTITPISREQSLLLDTRSSQYKPEVLCNLAKELISYQFQHHIH